jgi:hypothetical protein
MVFWDIPGGGEKAHPSVSYWNDQCLDLFDCLVLVIDNRFPEVAKYVGDLAIKNNRPFVVVHTKSQFYIDNTVANRRVSRKEAEADLRSNVRAAVRENLGPAGATARLMLIDSHALRTGSAELDEMEMIEFMVGCTAARSPTPTTAEELIARFRAANETAR